MSGGRSCRRARRGARSRPALVALACLLSDSAAADSGPGTYYDVLGVPKVAADSELRAALQHLGGKGADTALAEEAFRVLSDPGRRESYDGLLAADQEGSHGPPPGDVQQPNLALKRPTAQSSTRVGGGESQRAVDGVADARWNTGSCTHTSPQGERPWWAVDLGSATSVGRVRVLNRLEASDRLHHWQVRIGSDKLSLSTPCGPIHKEPAPSGAWVEADCGGREGRWVGVVLDHPGSILTVCEVEVFAKIDAGPQANRAVLARRYISEYYDALASPAREERSLYLRRAAELYAESLSAMSQVDVAGLERLYADVSNIPAPKGQPDVSFSAPFLLLRSQVLERIATSASCDERPAKCCSPALTRSAAGCMSLALSLAKMAGDVDGARGLYERSAEPPVLAEWPSYWQTCEVFIPSLRGGSALMNAFWDPADPTLTPTVSLVETAWDRLRADMEKLQSVKAFQPVLPALVEEGGVESASLYAGRQGWSAWCSQNAGQLAACSALRGKLPGEAAGVVERYLLDNHEEVSIFRLLPPRSILRAHSDRTNGRLNLDFALTEGGKVSL